MLKNKMQKLTEYYYKKLQKKEYKRVLHLIKKEVKRARYYTQLDIDYRFEDDIIKILEQKDGFIVRRTPCGKLITIEWK